jgi:3alpha(or 20beta)-hydroxysteroid dehydrogenase
MVVGARREVEGEAVAAEARTAGAEAGGDACFVAADVTDEGAVAALASTVRERCGPAVHVLFNNVGGPVGAGRFPKERLSNFEATLRLSVTSAWMVTQAFWPALEAAHGASVINTSTPPAAGAVPPGLRELLPFYPNSGYAASKAALEGLTRFLAQEGAPVDIRANFIRPGEILTPVSTMPDGRHFAHDYIAKIRLIDRPGTPADIAGAVVFLASDESSYITGQGIDIDGGISNKP